MRGKIPNVAYFLGRKYNGKRKDFISPFLVVLIPLSFVLLIFFSSYEPNSNYNELVFYSSLLIGNGIGLLYDLFVIFTARFKRLFNI